MQLCWKAPQLVQDRGRLVSSPRASGPNRHCSVWNTFCCYFCCGWNVSDRIIELLFGWVVNCVREAKGKWYVCCREDSFKWKFQLPCLFCGFPIPFSSCRFSRSAHSFFVLYCLTSGFSALERIIVVYEIDLLRHCNKWLDNFAARKKFSANFPFFYLNCVK